MSSWDKELEEIKTLVKDLDKSERTIYYEKKKKNVGIAVLLSILIPGFGHIYIGKIKRGLIILTIAIISSILCSVLIGCLTTPLIWLFSIHDSYQLAKDYNNKLYKVIFEEDH